jgi:hypothetical protein
MAIANMSDGDSSAIMADMMEAADEGGCPTPGSCAFSSELSDDRLALLRHFTTSSSSSLF